jgi:hypothetical protein
MPMKRKPESETPIEEPTLVSGERALVTDVWGERLLSDGIMLLRQEMEWMDAEDLDVAGAAKDRAAQILSNAKLSFSKMAELIEHRQLLLRPRILTNIKRMDGPGLLGDAAFRDVRSALRREGQSFREIAEALELNSRPVPRYDEAVNAETDPAPIEGITSPITLNRKPDGRIGVEPGPFSLPTVPAHLTPDNHHKTLAACRTRAVQLKKLASSPEFQGRSQYKEILSDYVEWLPSELGTGNILLADGEARTLNMLFKADEDILPTAFASRLAVLLQDHNGLRSYYPDIETHYEAIRKGRLIKPLPRDAVQAFQKIIRSQTPAVFDETVSPAIDEAAKPIPDIKPPLPEDMPPPDPNRPKPPSDPIADVDPRKSRSYTIASAINRIWSILQRGKDTAQAIEGWQKTYDLLKPHIGAIIDFLHPFLPGGSSGGGSLPPTIGA